MLTARYESINNNTYFKDIVVPGKKDAVEKLKFCNCCFCCLTFCIVNIVGRDSSVGVASRYGLDGPGIETRWRRDFPHLSRPALGPTQPPVQWIPGLSRG